MCSTGKGDSKPLFGPAPTPAYLHDTQGLFPFPIQVSLPYLNSGALSSGPAPLPMCFPQLSFPKPSSRIPKSCCPRCPPVPPQSSAHRCWQSLRRARGSPCPGPRAAAGPRSPSLPIATASSPRLRLRL